MYTLKTQNTAALFYHLPIHNSFIPQKPCMCQDTLHKVQCLG